MMCHLQQALWFCETFGLTPDFINLKKTATGSPVKMALSTPTCTTITTSLTTEEVQILPIILFSNSQAIAYYSQ